MLNNPCFKAVIVHRKSLCLAAIVLTFVKLDDPPFLSIFALVSIFGTHVQPISFPSSIHYPTNFSVFFIFCLFARSLDRSSERFLLIFILAFPLSLSKLLSRITPPYVRHSCAQTTTTSLTRSWAHARRTLRSRLKSS